MCLPNDVVPVSWTSPVMLPSVTVTSPDCLVSLDSSAETERKRHFWA